MRITAYMHPELVSHALVIIDTLYLSSTSTVGGKNLQVLVSIQYLRLSSLYTARTWGRSALGIKRREENELFACLIGGFVRLLKRIWNKPRVYEWKYRQLDFLLDRARRQLRTLVIS
jgi:hypothetical protein